MDEQDDTANINNLPAGILHNVFTYLGPRDLAAASAVSRHWRKLNRDKLSNSVWKKFYTSRWCVMGPAGDDVCWQSKYGSKMKQGKSWIGKYEFDSLYGHKAGVKALKLLPSCGMLLTGSLDRTIRLWDLNYGMPLSISRPHGGTVRSVALDEQLVASGSSDNVVRLWHARNATAGSNPLDPAQAAHAAAGSSAGGLGSLGLAEGLSLMDMDSSALDSSQLLAAAAASSSSVGLPSSSPSLHGLMGRHGPYSVITGDADESLFDLSLPGQQLRGHIGPVTSLCLTDSCLYSGSWDYTVRCWRRGGWDCISVLKYQDWVWSVEARGGLLLVASGPEVHVHDLPTGKLVRKFQNLHEGSVSCLEGTHSGKQLFTGGADGLLLAHDLRMKESSRVLWHHNAGVHGLALEDPWLVSAASDGTVVMHNTEMALPNSSSSGSSSSLPSRRSLSCPGHSGPMYCVDIAESWLAAGGESPAVRTWDFTKAAEAAARAAAARAARSNSKRAKMRKAAAAGAGGGAGGAGDAGDVGAAAGIGGKCGGSRKSRGSGGTGSAAAAGGSASWHSAAAAAVVVGSSAAAAAAAAGSPPAAAASISRRKPKGLLAAAAAAARAEGAAAAGSGPATAATCDRYHRLQHVAARRQEQQAPGAASTAAAAPGADTATGDGGGRAGAGSGLGGVCVPNGNRQVSQSNHQHRQHHSNGHHGSSYGYSSSPQQQQWHGPYSSSPQQQQQQQHWQGRYSSSPQQQWLGSSPASRLQTHANRSHATSQQQQQQRGSGSLPHSSQSRWAPNGSSGAGGSISSRATGNSIPIAGTGSRQGGAHHYHKQAGRAANGRAAAGAAAAAASGGSGTAAAAGGGSGGDDDSCNDGNCGLSSSPAGAAAAASSYRVPFSSSYPSAGQPGPWLGSGSSHRFGVVMHHACAGGAADKPGGGVVQGRDGEGLGAAGTELDGPGSISN